MSGTEHPDAPSPQGTEAITAAETTLPAEVAPVDPAAGMTEMPAPMEPATTEEISPGIEAPAATAPMPQARSKTKGVADIVFVVDVSGSMSTCIDALRQNIEAFVNSLSQGDANNAAPV